VSDYGSHASEVRVGSERSFGLVFAAVFLIIALYPMIRSGDIRLWALVVAVLFVVICLVCPVVLRPLNVVWFKFGMFLASVIPPVVMAVIFFIVVTPTGLLLRLFGKDVLRLRLDRSKVSYWIPRSRDSNTSSSMKDQF